MTDSHSREAPGTVLADDFANKQGKPDPGEGIKGRGAQQRGENLCSAGCYQTFPARLPGDLKGHPVPTYSKFGLATQMID